MSNIMTVEQARNVRYPIPDSPHTSVLNRNFDERAAYKFGWVDCLDNLPGALTEKDWLNIKLAAIHLKEAKFHTAAENLLDVLARRRVAVAAAPAAPVAEPLDTTVEQDVIDALRGSGFDVRGETADAIVYGTVHHGALLIDAAIQAFHGKAAASTGETPEAGEQSDLPPEWISEVCGPDVDDLSYGQGCRRGFNDCRKKVLELRTASQQPQDERAAFQEVMQRHGYNMTMEAADPADYAFPAMRAAWRAWQARAALASATAKPNGDCSGDPANCPDNEGFGCACAGTGTAFGKTCNCTKGASHG